MRAKKENARNKARGPLNLDSKATSEHWDWSDFSREIEWLCQSYAASMPLPLPEEALLADRKVSSKTEMAIFIAEKELELNEWFIGFGTSSDIFDYLVLHGGVYHHRVIRLLAGYAALEVDTGYPCQPHIVYGLADVAYPQILPIVRQRILDGAREEQAR